LCIDDARFILAEANRLTTNDKDSFMHWTVYLSGERHSDWRQQLIDGARKLDLPASFSVISRPA